MNGQRRTRPRDAGRRLRWDRIAIMLAILLLASLFWWSVISLALHRPIL